MDISEEMVEKTIESIENPKEKIKLNRLYLLYKLYMNTKPQKITYDKINDSINKINAKFKKYMKEPNNQEEMKNILNRVISANTMLKGSMNSRKITDDLLYDLTYLEYELLLVPSFPSYLGSVLKDKVETYSINRLARGRR